MQGNYVYGSLRSLTKVWKQYSDCLIFIKVWVYSELSYIFFVVGWFWRISHRFSTSLTCSEKFIHKEKNVLWALRELLNNKQVTKRMFSRSSQSTLTIIAFLGTMYIKYHELQLYLILVYSSYLRSYKTEEFLKTSVKNIAKSQSLSNRACQAD